MELTIVILVTILYNVTSITNDRGHTDLEQREWLVLSYTLPREPSRYRVSLWRKLKKIGAVSIQQSLWFLPLTKENCIAFDDIKNEVTLYSGEALVMKTITEAETSEKIIGRFNEARNEEYTELIEQSQAFFREIDKETARKNFSFAEIEENEEELQKLRQWFEKIVLRDTFSASLRADSEKILAQCAEVLNDFCEKVYDYCENR
jgi:hypothetical protein